MPTHMPAVAYNYSSEQPLPLVYDEGRFRSSAVWFEAHQSLMAYYPAYGRLPAWHTTRDNQVDLDPVSLVANRPSSVEEILQIYRRGHYFTGHPVHPA
jgi:hypothetical protein